MIPTRPSRHLRPLSLLVTALAVGLTACVGNLPVRVSGFQPIQPALTYRARFGEVDSLRPTLRWAPFPGTEYDYSNIFTPVGYQPRPFVSVDGAITNIRYDLIIWKAVKPKYDDFSGLGSGTFTGRVWASVESLMIVYERTGLTEPAHTLETTLEPDTDYAWSVRARFDVNGETRASEWSLVVMPAPPLSKKSGCMAVNTDRSIFNSHIECPRAPGSRAHARLTGEPPSYALFYFHTPSL